MALTYKDAGVDIDAGERLIDRIRPMAKATRIPEVLGGLGGFAGLCSVPSGMTDPVLVSGTDGVGTKLKLAFELDQHETVGIDLVAMCVNDILTVGARPLFFLDYFATGSLDVERAAAVVSGIAHGCTLSGCALLGGETAELPGFYAPGEYDLAGFAVGVVERSKILDGTQIEAGDRLLGIASSGLHSNGFSLARRALADAGVGFEATPPEFAGARVGDVLLEPTRIYARAAAAALEAGARGLCHITGGGLPGNLPRVLPEGLGAVVVEPEMPLIFRFLQTLAGIERSEMRRAFNLGVGLVVCVPEAEAEGCETALVDAGETVFSLGRVEKSSAVGEARVRYETSS